MVVLRFGEGAFVFVGFLVDLRTVDVFFGGFAVVRAGVFVGFAVGCLDVFVGFGFRVHDPPFARLQTSEPVIGLQFMTSANGASFPACTVAPQ